MGRNLSKYDIDGITNLRKELNIDINNIKACQHRKLEDNHQYSLSYLDIDIIKNAIISMDSCNHISTNYIYNTKHRINLIFKDDTEIILALSDCGSYVGIPTRASGWGIWFYLIDPNHINKYTPFNKIITTKL